MRLDTRPPMPAPAREVPAEKPLSAQFCHGLALVSAIIAFLWLLGTLTWFFESPDGFVVAGGAAISALCWWVIGDLVCGVAQRSRRRD